MSDSEFLPGVPNIEALAKMFIESLVSVNRAVNELPSIRDDFGDPKYDSYRQILTTINQRLLHLTERFMHYLGIRGSIDSNELIMDTDDRFHILSDANSELAERIGILLDEASGIKKDDVSLVVVSRTLNQLTPGLKLSRVVNTRTDAGGSSFTMLTGKNIPKPQLLFRDKVDNSNQVFFPKIKHKPNAQLSLEDSLKIELPDDYENDPSFSFPHPYQFELQNFVPDKQFLETVVPAVPPALDLTPLTLINDIEGLTKLVQCLKTETEIAVDLEHHSFRSFLGFTCLMQISTRKEDYIVDTLLLRDDLHVLNDIFTDPKILKVFHGANSDIEWLQKDFGIFVVNMFDSGQASRALGLSRFSLAFLMKHYCGIEANKKYQTADWRLRPLPDDMLKYAREDTHYLLYIFDCMKDDLVKKDNGQTSLLLSVFANSTHLCLKKYKKPRLTDASHEEFYHQQLNRNYDKREVGSALKNRFNDQQLNALKNLYAWRDRVARQQDESVSYVLPNHMLLQICEILPRETSGIVAICVPKPPMVQSHMDEIHRIILKSRQLPMTTVKKSPKKENSTQLPINACSSSLFLNCPHDLSHQNETCKDLDFTAVSQGSLPSKTQTQFGFNGVVQEKSAPDVSMFDHAVLHWKSRKVSKDLEKVVSLFAAYFVGFLPSNLLSEKVSLLNQEKKMQWKLFPHSSLQLPDADRSKLTTSVTRELSEVHAEKVEEVSLTERPIHLYSSRKRTSDAKESSELLPVSKKEKRAEKTKPVAEDDFSPYSYDSSDISKLLGEAHSLVGDHVRAKKKKRDFGSNLEFQDSGLKTNRLPRSNLEPGNRTMTYTSKNSGSHSKPQIHWPKK